MAGMTQMGKNSMTYEFLRRTDYDFSNLVANQSMTLWLAENINVADYREGLVVFRMMVNPATWPTGASIVFQAYGVLPSDEDPTTKYRVTLGGGSSVTIPASDQGAGKWPGLYAFNLGTYFGALISISAAPTLAAATGTFKFTLSAVLCAKD